MRMLALPGLVLLVACVVWAACAQRRELAGTTPRRHVPYADLLIGQTPVRAHVARTHADRARGLGGVRRLAAGEGMLFVYPDLERRQFWMRDCLIALDIAFLSADGQVLLIETLQPPSADGETPARTQLSPPSAFVLELPAGFFERNGLGVNTLVRIPTEVGRETAE